MKTDKQGCSTCPVGEERYESYFHIINHFKTVFRVQYDYRHTNGRLFSTIASNLEEARARRDNWLKQFNQ